MGYSHTSTERSKTKLGDIEINLDNVLHSDSDLSQDARSIIESRKRINLAVAMSFEVKDGVLKGNLNEFDSFDLIAMFLLLEREMDIRGLELTRLPDDMYDSEEESQRIDEESQQIDALDNDAFWKKKYGF